jgi:hypothetical protein
MPPPATRNGSAPWVDYPAMKRAGDLSIDAIYHASFTVRCKLNVHLLKGQDHLTTKDQNMKKLFSTVLLALALVVAAISTPAASFAAAPQALPAQPNVLTYLRVIHASPDAPNVDVYVNGARVVRNLRYGRVSAYITVKPGEAQVQVVRAGRSLSRGPVVIDQKVTLEVGKAYTVAAAGKLAEIKPFVYADDWDAPGKGQARLRVIHLSPDAPAIDVVATPQGATESAKVVTNAAFGEASDYVTLNSGGWNFDVKVAGTENTALLLDGMTVAEGRVSTVFAIGLVNGRPSLSGVTSVDATATPSRLRVLHASPDAPAVDVYLNGFLELRNVRYKTISNLIDVLPGEHRIQIVPAGKTLAQGPVVIDTPLTVEKGKVYVVAAAGLLASIKPIVAVDAGEQPAAGRGQVRVWHLSPDAPAVDVVLTEGAKKSLAQNLSFEQVTPYTEVMPGAQATAVQANGQTVFTTNLVVPANGSLTMYIVGLVSGTPAAEGVVFRDR